MIYAIAAIVVALAYLLLKKKKKKSGWHIEYSPGMPTKPTPTANGWKFDFPTNPSSHVHYVQQFSPPRLVGTIIAKFKVTGTSFTPQEHPSEPATASLLIQRKGDDWTARGQMASYRWYSNEQIKLADGEFILSVPLDVAWWGDVYGGKNANLFDAALSKTANIGLVFGSPSGRGHGVYSTEPASFELLSLEVI